ncbi:MAG: hypothetical protein RMA76_04380 [Deltaproteobacteria bacterium]|jgi:hypothetical protein
MSPQCYASLDEVEALIARFEAGELPLREWTHATHLTVGVWYLLHLPEHEAAARTIDGIRAHNRVHGIRLGAHRGYHETITLFWLAVTRSFLDRVTKHDAPLELVNAFVAELSHRSSLIFDFYSRARLQSWKARHYWIEPDLQSLASI